MRPFILALFAFTALGQTPSGNALDKYGNPGRGEIFKQQYKEFQPIRLVAPHKEFKPIRLVTPPPAVTDCAAARIVGPLPGFESKMPLVPADPEIDPKIRLKAMPGCEFVGQTPRSAADALVGLLPK